MHDPSSAPPEWRGYLAAFDRYLADRTPESRLAMRLASPIELDDYASGLTHDEALEQLLDGVGLSEDRHQLALSAARVAGLLTP